MQNTTTTLPVRGNDVAEILTHDHDSIKSTLRRLPESTGSQRKATLEDLKIMLTIHNATEENLVYPALAKVAGHNTESKKLYHETAEADMLVFELDMMIKEGDESDFEKTAKKLEKAVLEHIEDEEESALPHLRDKTESSQGRMLTESVRKFRSELHVGPSTESTRSKTGEILRESEPSRSR